MICNVIQDIHKPLPPDVLPSKESHQEVLAFIRNLRSDHSSCLLTPRDVPGRYYQCLIVWFCSFIRHGKKEK